MSLGVTTSAYAAAEGLGDAYSLLVSKNELEKEWIMSSFIFPRCSFDSGAQSLTWSVMRKESFALIASWWLKPSVRSTMTHKSLIPQLMERASKTSFKMLW